MERRLEEIQRETDCYRRIIVGIPSAPETEAFETLRSFGAEGEIPPSALVAAVEAGMLRHPTAAEGDVRHIDQEALKESRYKLPAKPWTSVAGDGLVSHLITDHLSLDNQDPFGRCLSLLDPDLFLRDMIGGNPKNSQFCSHSLVNTICGLRSLYSPIARKFNEATRTDLAKQFAAEAAEQLETELEDRKGHVTTLQSLYYFSRLPPDLHMKRAGSSYYLDVLDYIKTCDLEDVILREPRTSNPEDANKRRALFKTYWAIFNLECIRRSPCLKIPAVKHIPLSPLPPYGPGTIPDPTDIRAVTIPSNSYPSVNGISHLLYRAMSYNMEPQGRVGEERDMVPRRHFLFELSELGGRLIPGGYGVDAEDSGSIQTKLYLNMVAYNVLRPLPSDTTVHVGHTTATARDHLLAFATTDITLTNTYLTSATSPYSPAIDIPLRSAVFTFVPFLSDASTHEAFTRGCALLHNFECNMHSIRTIRRGVLAVAWKIGMTLPPSALQYFEGLEEEVRAGKVEPGEVLVDVVIALPREVLTRVLGEDKEDAGGLDLGAVLGEWGEALLRDQVRCHNRA
ncbi:hypothetical protein B0J18DRAFT_374541 [Chaetomium sp. MPI-SDFR-AT-0129]|nr:hypothetical protein B0J18DRAFT_374541 [Chaetomium sp. MPI-SDFR-AT-0129]